MEPGGRGAESVGNQGPVSSVVQALRSFYAVLVQPQSYLNLVYLLLAFPLGIFYFVFLVTGLSVGLATSIIWIGLGILLLMGAAWFLLASFERWLTVAVLRRNAPARAAAFSGTAPMPSSPVTPVAPGASGAWARLKAHLRNTTTWTSLLYLLSKFPLGVVSFCVVVTSLSVSAALVLAPWFYAFSDCPLAHLDVGPWTIGSWGAAWLVTAIGLFVIFPVSLHVMNGLARLSGWWAGELLRTA